MSYRVQPPPWLDSPTRRRQRLLTERMRRDALQATLRAGVILIGMWFALACYAWGL